MPERLVIHLDLDAFYCQVESLRLKLDPSLPIAVQQWNSVIAVNYPARARGITRHLSVDECRQKCPEVGFVHVATFSIDSQEEYKSYPLSTLSSPVPLPDSRRCKAALEPYRRASRQVFNLLKQRVGEHGILEKASVDEVFIEVLNINALANEIEQFIGFPIVEIMNDQPDASNIYVQKGTVIAHSLRKLVFEELGYTMSAGIAHNKMLSKLASPRHKPNQQTYVLHEHINEVMRTTPFEKIRFLGGKLGSMLRAEDQDEDNDDIHIAQVQSQDHQTAFDLQKYTEKELQSKVGLTAPWVYNIVRGVDTSPVIDRSLTKSFLSAKQFRPPLKDPVVVDRWVMLFSRELKMRLQEEVEQSQRWPRSITLVWRKAGGNSRSKATDFFLYLPDHLKIHCMVMNKLVNPLMEQLIPLVMLGINLGRFKVVGSNLKIDSFLSSQPTDPNKCLFPSEVSEIETRKVSKKNSARWACQRCLLWFEEFEVERIREHEDFHVAMDMAKQY